MLAVAMGIATPPVSYSPSPAESCWLCARRPVRCCRAGGESSSSCGAFRTVRACVRLSDAGFGKVLPAPIVLSCQSLSARTLKSDNHKVKPYFKSLNSPIFPLPETMYNSDLDQIFHILVKRIPKAHTLSHLSQFIPHIDNQLASNSQTKTI